MALGLLAASPAHALPSDPDLSARDRETLAHGGIVVRLRDTRDSTLKDVLCAGVVHASTERVWSVLVDYDHYGRIFPRILKSEVRARATTRTTTPSCTTLGPFAIAGSSTGSRLRPTTARSTGIASTARSKRWWAPGA